MNLITSLIVSALATLCHTMYTEKQQKLLNDIAEECAAKLDMELTYDYMQRFIYSGDLPDDAMSKKFIICTQKKIVEMDADGKIQSQKIIDNFADNHDIRALTEVILKCSSVEGDTVEEKVYNFYKCLWIEKNFDL
ncbi:uncharacterized protein LOC131428429 [Malaya genurostris]|uniref:uncharacterized protein LOC131428429 n=1 Tax=Malaya genurostris TaxID=325434 RepID=UPI0026F38BE6|nr:uncharacterized protein LOC131428429 [Malaya genurostris]